MTPSGQHPKVSLHSQPSKFGPWAFVTPSMQHPFGWVSHGQPVKFCPWAGVFKSGQHPNSLY